MPESNPSVKRSPPVVSENRNDEPDRHSDAYRQAFQYHLHGSTRPMKAVWSTAANPAELTA